MKLRELKEKAEEFTEGPFTDGPFTDEFTPTTSISTDPEELSSTPDVFTDQPTEMLSTTEVLPTEYPGEEWEEGEVLNDEQQTGEESEEEEGEDEVSPEESLNGGVGEEEGDEEEGPVSQEESSRINILSRLMSERRKQRMKHWLKRGKAMKNTFKNWFNKKRGDD